MAEVLHLFRAPKRRLPMQELRAVRALENVGFEGCAHARRGSKRQVLLVDRETLEAMSLGPGMIRENITTHGLNVNGLAMGQRLRVGEAKLEVSAVCTPCDQLEKIRPGLRPRIARTARDVVPGHRGRRDPTGRRHRDDRVRIAAATNRDSALKCSFSCSTNPAETCPILRSAAELPRLIVRTAA